MILTSRFEDRAQNKTCSKTDQTHTLDLNVHEKHQSWYLYLKPLTAGRQTPPLQAHSRVDAGT